MRQQIVTVTGASTGSTIIPMNLDTSPFNVGFGATVTGTVSYSIQHTFDNPWTTASPVWFFHPSTPSGTPVTAALDGNYAFPVAAIRILTSSSTNSGTVTLTTIQAGIA